MYHFCLLATLLNPLTLSSLNSPFVISIYSKPRVAVAIFDLERIKMTWCGWQMTKIYRYLNSSMKIVVLKSLGFRKLSHSSEMQNDALLYSEGPKG